MSWNIDSIEGSFFFVCWKNETEYVCVLRYNGSNHVPNISWKWAQSTICLMYGIQFQLNHKKKSKKKVRCEREEKNHWAPYLNKFLIFNQCLLKPKCLHFGQKFAFDSFDSLVPLSVLFFSFSLSFVFILSSFCSISVFYFFLLFLAHFFFARLFLITAIFDFSVRQSFSHFIGILMKIRTAIKFFASFPHFGRWFLFYFFLFFLFKANTFALQSFSWAKATT